MEEARGGERAAGEDHPAFGAVRQDQPFLFSGENHVVIAGDRSASQRGKADRAFAPLERGPDPATVGQSVEVDTTPALG